MTTIASPQSTGIALTSGYNPLTILATGGITAADNAIYGNTAAYWTIDNAGTVIGGSSTAPKYQGIGIAGSAAVVNDATSALIEGYNFGVLIKDAGSVVNDGTIVNTGTTVYAYVYNQAPVPSITPHAGGVVLGSGGVSNAAGATVAGVLGIGLYGDGSIVNAGLVSASGTALGTGIGMLLAGSDSVTNTTSGLIAAGVRGVLGVGEPDTVVNAGTILGTAASGILLASGGAVFNDGGRLSGSSQGVFFYRGGYVSNSGTIAGYLGITVANAAGTVVNDGGIIDGSYEGIVLNGGGRVSNAATIYGGHDGINLNDGGYVANTGSIGGYQGVVVAYAPGTVVNTAGTIGGGIAGVALFDGGYISNTGKITGAYAVFAKDSATVVNSGSIGGDNYGVVVRGTGTLVNSGTITNSQYTAHATTDLVYGGNLTNAATGTIAGHWEGVAVGNVYTAATVTSTIVNAGSIGALDKYGDGADLWLRGAVYVRNSGIISAGPFGVVLYGQSTVVNLGTITGGTYRTEGAIAPGNATLLAANASLLLEEAPGAVLSGNVIAPVGSGGTAANTLELLAGTQAGTITGFGTRYEDFGNIVINTGADWLVSGAAQGFASETISGLAPGSTLELTGTVEGYAALAGGFLTLSGGTTLDLPGVTRVTVGNDGSDTFITACFATGTKLLAAGGPVAVEALREGDRLVTSRGLAPIRWIGHRRTDLVRHARPHDVQPVRVVAGAFGPAQPSRDLVLSPDHAVFVDGALVPIRHLVNGVSIVQETRASITYWHVELARHEVVFAEGLPCETYLDTGNRGAFENADGAVQLHPDFARAIWAEQGCAAILTDPADPRLRALHTSLLARARAYGAVISTSTGTWSEGWARTRSSRSGAA